jgi:hypothetical protein
MPTTKLDNEQFARYMKERRGEPIPLPPIINLSAAQMTAFRERVKPPTLFDVNYKYDGDSFAMRRPIGWGEEFQKLIREQLRRGLGPLTVTRYYHPPPSFIMTDITTDFTLSAEGVITATGAKTFKPKKRKGKANKGFGGMGGSTLSKRDRYQMHAGKPGRAR